ncbi:sialoadhesin-like isoform X2 [Haliotis asinina]|uniref:sialoadhesin-like isoform X2 n=1 Tax=Haliotis asinina TaxID=109174 RepID=UPI0035325741
MSATDLVAVLVVAGSFGLPLIGLADATSFTVVPSNGNATMSWNVSGTDIREFTVFLSTFPAKDIFHVKNNATKIVSDDYKNRVQLFSNRSSDGSVVFGFELFNVSSWDDAGEYGCYEGPPDYGGARISECRQTLIVVDLIQEPYLVVPEYVTDSARTALQCLTSFRSHPIGYRPKVSVTWSKNDKPLEGSSGYTMTADTGMWDMEVYHAATLDVRNVGVEGEGARYSCQVAIGDGIQTDWSEEYVLGTKFSEDGPKNYSTAVDGDEVMLSFWNLNITDTLSLWSPKQTVLFTMESAKVKIWSSYRPRVTIGSVIAPNKAVRVILRNVSATDAGQYVCGRGAIDRKVIVPNCGLLLVVLRQPVKPVITVPSQPVSGQTITVNCSTFSRSFPLRHPLSMSFSWFKDGALLEQEGKYMVLGSTLTISDVTTGDTGRYSCQAKEEEGLVSEFSDAEWMDIQGGYSGTISAVVVAVAVAAIIVTVIVFTLRKRHQRRPFVTRMSPVCEPVTTPERDIQKHDTYYSTVEIKQDATKISN